MRESAESRPTWIAGFAWMVVAASATWVAIEVFGSDGIHGPVVAVLAAVAAGFALGWPWAALVLAPFALWAVTAWNHSVGPFDNGGGLLLAVFVIPMGIGVAVGLGVRFIIRR